MVYEAYQKLKEIERNMKLFKKVDNQYEIGKWYVGWKSPDVEITYNTSGYHYGKAELHISLFGWHSLFRLPWEHKNKNNWSISGKKYGFNTFNHILVFHFGLKTKCWELPFVSYGNVYRWVRYKGKPASYYLDTYEKENWETHPYKTGYEGGCQNPNCWTYNFTDPYDGEVIPCKFWVEEMEWRPKWLKWTKRFAKTQRYIVVEFSKEMGSEKGTWKGGTVGESYELLPDEHPTHCIRRIEKEYKQKG
jgi:hypothetical protein